MLPRPLESIDTLIIHCAATPPGKSFTPEDIDRWHGERGFKRAALTDAQFIKAMPAIVHHEPNLKHIGYHYVILLNGAVRCGRNEREVGAHAEGHNLKSIGTCLIGTDQFTPVQWDVLRLHVLAIQKRFQKLNGNRPLKVIGHREVSNKICPGFDVSAWLAGDLKPLEGHVFAGVGR